MFPSIIASIRLKGGTLMTDWLMFGEAFAAGSLILGCTLPLFYRKLHKSRQLADNAVRMINNLSEGVYAAELNGSLKSANRALVRLHGYSSEREMLDTVNATKAEFYVERGRQAEFNRALHRDGYVQDFVSEIYRQKTGERIWVSESARLVIDQKTGIPTYYEGSLRDITESIRKRQAEMRLNKLADMAPGGLFQLRRESDGRYLVPFLSQPFKALTGIEADMLSSTERPLLAGVDDTDFPDYLKSLTDSYTKLKPWNCVFRYRRKPDAALQWLEIKALPECADNGAIEWYGCIADISEHKELVQRIERLAYFDPLTDLPNRRLLMNRLDEATKISGRRRRHGGLLFLDLDGFKQINDTYGHNVGDVYITKIARCLESSLRESDTVARLGGDEFVILLHDLNTDVDAAKSDASMVATKLMANLRRGVELNGVIQSVGCSMGINVFKGGAEVVTALLFSTLQKMSAFKAKKARHKRKMASGI
jgi:diguanylate cyclase (GGDEF)-like protein/PAS domain S-box-containing protein